MLHRGNVEELAKPHEDGLNIGIEKSISPDWEEFLKIANFKILYPKLINVVYKIKKTEEDVDDERYEWVECFSKYAKSLRITLSKNKREMLVKYMERLEEQGINISEEYPELIIIYHESEYKQDT